MPPPFLIVSVSSGIGLATYLGSLPVHLDPFACLPATMITEITPLSISSKGEFRICHFVSLCYFMECLHSELSSTNQKHIYNNMWLFFSNRKAKIDRTSPKNANIMSMRVRDLFFIICSSFWGMSVRHFSVVGKYFFFSRSIIPPALIRRKKLQ